MSTYPTGHNIPKMTLEKTIMIGRSDIEFLYGLAVDIHQKSRTTLSYHHSEDATAILISNKLAEIITERLFKIVSDDRRRTKQPKSNS